MKGLKLFSKWTGKIALFIAILTAGIAALEFLLVPPLAGGMTTINYRDLMSQKQNVDIAFIGTSKIYRGIDAPTLSESLDKNVVGMGTAAQIMTETYYFTNELYKKNKPEMVFIDMSTVRLYREESNYINYIRNMKFNFDKFALAKEKYGKLKINSILGFLNYREQFFTGKICENTRIKLSKGYRDFDIEYMDKMAHELSIVGGNSIYKGKGYWKSTSTMKDGNAGNLYFPDRYFSDGLFFNVGGIDIKQIYYLERTIKLCKDNGTRVILFNTVQPYAFAGSYVDQYDMYLDYVQLLVEKYGIEFYDFTMLKKDKFERKDDLFFDWVHMNEVGAEKFEAVLADFYNNVLNGNIDSDEYLYGSCTELVNDCRFIYSAKISYDAQEGLFQTAIISGNLSEEVEYQYQYRIAEGEDFTTFRDWSTISTASSELIDESGRLTVRVNARRSGTDLEFEQYHTMPFRGPVSPNLDWIDELMEV